MSKLTSLLALSLFVVGTSTLTACDKKDDSQNDDDDDDDGSEGDDDDDDDDDDDNTTGGDDDDDNVECGMIQCLPGNKEACPEGEKCTPYRCNPGACCTDTTRCMPVTGQKLAGEPCTRDGVEGIDDCGPSLFCLPNKSTTAGNGPGTCIQLCNPEDLSADQCDKLDIKDGHCFNFNSGSFPVCLPICDPLDPVCPEGEACYFGVDDFFCTDPSEPPTEGEGKQGNGCDTEQGCAPGFACAPPDIFQDCKFTCDGTAVCGCCSQYCDMSKGDEDCTTANPNFKCLDVPGDRPGVENVGVCGLPK